MLPGRIRVALARAMPAYSGAASVAAVWPPVPLTDVGRNAPREGGHSWPATKAETRWAAVAWTELGNLRVDVQTGGVQLRDPPRSRQAFVEKPSWNIQAWISVPYCMPSFAPTPNRSASFTRRPPSKREGLDAVRSLRATLCESASRTPPSGHRLGSERLFRRGTGRGRNRFHIPNLPSLFVDQGIARQGNCHQTCFPSPET